MYLHKNRRTGIYDFEKSWAIDVKCLNEVVLLSTLIRYSDNYLCSSWQICDLVILYLCNRLRFSPLSLALRCRFQCAAHQLLQSIFDSLWLSLKTLCISPVEYWILFSLKFLLFSMPFNMLYIFFYRQYHRIYHRACLICFEQTKVQFVSLPINLTLWILGICLSFFKAP